MIVLRFSMQGEDIFELTNITLFRSIIMFCRIDSIPQNIP